MAGVAQVNAAAAPEDLHAQSPCKDTIPWSISACRQRARPSWLGLWPQCVYAPLMYVHSPRVWVTIREHAAGMQCKGQHIVRIVRLLGLGRALTPVIP